MDATMAGIDKIVMADPKLRAEAMETEKSFATTPKQAAKMTAKDAFKYCANNPDARESGRDDESLISVRACANRILSSQAALVRRHGD